MISYCPLDDNDTITRPPVPQPPRSRRPLALAAPKESGFLEGEDTECNYLVLFFILGVMILACSDSVSIRK